MTTDTQESSTFSKINTIYLHIDCLIPIKVIKRKKSIIHRADNGYHGDEMNILLLQHPNCFQNLRVPFMYQKIVMKITANLNCQENLYLL